jgi:UDPglucose--hexose-1-phosphate uridylyltransferase
MVASHRQSRPQLPKDYCPFCPGSGKVPGEGFSVLRYPNDFPALSQTPPEPDDVAGGLFVTAPAYGKCEVLLYSDKHKLSLGELSDGNVHDLAELWYDCFNDLASDEKIKYIYLFENRGEPVGVTMPHPHGQAYGYSFLPKKIAEELEGAREYKEQHGGCVFCDLLAQELADGRRRIFENEFFAVYVPFFSQITYGVHVTAKRHVPHIAAMTLPERRVLGETLRDCAAMYDRLFDLTFPYMLCMHNAPPGAYADEYYHFHVEFYPPLRAADKQQFAASSETGAGAWCIPNSPEEKAAELRAAYKKLETSRSGDS